MQLGPTIISEGNQRHNKFKLKQQNRPAKPSLPKDVVRGKVEPQTRQPTAPPASEIAHTDDKTFSEDNETSDSDSSTSSPSSVNDEPDASRVAENTASNKQKVKATTARPLLRPPKTLRATMFDRLEAMYGGKVKRMLDVQYRYVIPVTQSGVILTGSYCLG